jgi:copper oxidase (laccase) domain-containing protein
MKPILSKKLPIGYFLVYDQRPNISLIEANQVHGIHLLTPDKSGQEGDGLITKSNDDCLAIKTADCLPIVVLGHHGRALLHAGWRGLQQNIVDQDKIRQIAPYYFFIGPSIQCHSFQVTEEFHKHFPHSSHLYKQGGFDLQQELKEQVAKYYKNAQVDDCSLDTYSDQRFHSYRRDKTSLRNWNLLVNEL